LGCKSDFENMILNKNFYDNICKIDYFEKKNFKVKKIVCGGSICIETFTIFLTGLKFFNNFIKKYL
jgi:hypothetical protein